MLRLEDRHQEQLDTVGGSGLLFANKAYAWRFAADEGCQQTRFDPVHQRRSAELTDIGNVSRLTCAPPGLFG